ncbi:unnamed protein product [Heterobilharzia americana]|nr:unnamed protein product [Heterobilharzia americana]
MLLVFELYFLKSQFKLTLQKYLAEKPVYFHAKGFVHYFGKEKNHFSTEINKFCAFCVTFKSVITLVSTNHLKYKKYANLRLILHQRDYSGILKQHN